MLELQGRRALVTGAAQGLGRAIAELFVQRGVRVMLADIDERGVARLADRLGPAARSLRCDVASADDWQRSVEATSAAFGGFDTLVNNAGVEVARPLFEQTEAEFDRLMAINVKGVFLGMRHAHAALATSGRGSIVNLSSLAGVGGAPLFGLYGASKAAVIQLTRVAAVELKISGVRVNAVCPAFVDTAMVDRLVPTVEAVVGVAFKDLVALKQGRLGTPAEVAEMVAFLASDHAGFINGAHYVLDGGMAASLL